MFPILHIPNVLENLKRQEKEIEDINIGKGRNEIAICIWHDCDHRKTHRIYKIIF